MIKTVNIEMAKKAKNALEGEIKLGSEEFKVHTFAFHPVTYEGKMSFFTAEMDTKLSYNEIVEKLIKVAKEDDQFYKELVKIIKEGITEWENPNTVDRAKLFGIVE